MIPARLPMPDVPDDHLLRIMLPMAVMLYVRGFESAEPADVFRHVDGVAERLCTRGDVLLYGSKIKGEAAELFNLLAKAVAALAFVPGGVTVFGTHYEAQFTSATTAPMEGAEP